ncbi:MAG: hypothetical protein NVS1B13_19230 [Flavisolibacter sp.]
MKDSCYYFPHDLNARGDIKIQALIHDYKARGYGIYWVIVEMLHEATDNMLPLKTYTYLAIAKQLNETADFVDKLIQACITEYELFIKVNNSFQSKRVNKNIARREEISKTRSKAGKNGAIAKQVQANAEQVQANAQQNLAKPSKEKKESKGKEIKVEKVEQPAPKNFKQLLDTEFFNAIAVFKNQYPKEMLRAFYNYWSEKSPAGKMKFQLEDTWELDKRLLSWKNREANFTGKVVPIVEEQKLPSRYKKLN